MKTVDWLDIVDTIGDANCAYNALVSLLAWSTKELTDDERFGVFIINNHIFDSLKSALNDIDRLHRPKEKKQMKLSLDEFKGKAEDYIETLNKDVLILTHNGEEKLAVMDIARYNEFYELAQAAALLKVLAQREEQFKNGDYLTMDELKEKTKSWSKEN